MVEVRTHSYRGAEDVLREKELLLEIEEALQKVESVKSGTTPKVLQGFLVGKGWDIEKVLLKGTKYRHDAYKKGVLIEIDVRGSLIDAVHRNFLRAQVLHIEKRVDVLVQVTDLEREPKFDNVKRDIELYRSVLTVPIYLIGLG